MPAVAAVLRVTDHCGISYRITVIIRGRTRLFCLLKHGGQRWPQPQDCLKASEKQWAAICGLHTYA